MSKTTTALKAKKLSSEVQSLKGEVRRLRSLVIGIVGKDEEGIYKPVVAKEVLKAADEPARFTFKDKKSFLRRLSRA